MYLIKYDKKIFDLEKIEMENEITIHKLICNESQKNVTVEISAPATGISYHWHPLRNFDSSLKPDWDKGRKVSITESAPIDSFYNQKGRNIITIAHNELVNNTIMKSGIREEDGNIIIKMIFEDVQINNIYEVYVDTRELKFYDSIEDVSKWWESTLNVFPVHSKYKTAMYSTWYSYHQDLKESLLIKDIEKMKHYGLSSIILDDGWQTDDNNRGYAFCGDWEISSTKFENFGKMVDKFHDNNISVMVWFSVPYIGENSKQWEKFSDKILYHDKGRKAGVLDLRYQENIDFLVNVYLNFCKKYNVDGLKLDFIDEFYLRDTSPQYNNDMDYESITVALNSFLAKLKSTILDWRPDIFIEFRQKYIGPKMREYSNAFRVIDCPYSGISNRVGIIDMRLLNKETPVHSDMLMWTAKDTPEDVALQLISCLLGTIQISLDFSKQSKIINDVITHYINFANENINILQESKLHVVEPEHQYPHVYVENDDEVIHILYMPNRVVSLENKKTTIINGTGFENIYLDSKVNISVTIFKCDGSLQLIKEINVGLNKIIIPSGGMLIFN